MATRKPKSAERGKKGTQTAIGDGGGDTDPGPKAGRGVKKNETRAKRRRKKPAPTRGG